MGWGRAGFQKALTSLAFAASVLAANAGLAQEKTVLKVVMHSGLRITDPIITTAYIARNHGYMIYDTLFATDERFEIKPQMVKDYTVSDDKLTYTFTLREGSSSMTARLSPRRIASPRSSAGANATAWARSSWTSPRSSFPSTTRRSSSS
jgi:ABC-type oligopeptide transport system substrate-binding subunit